MKKILFAAALLSLLAGCNQTKSDMKETQKKAIENYIESYNSFDVNGMIKDLDDQVVFENVSGGQVDMKLDGLEAFKGQAEAAKSYFQQREQTVTSWSFEDDQVTIEIDYTGILAIELPNGMKPGDTLNLKGKSIFTFAGEKITVIRDES